MTTLAQPPTIPKPAQVLRDDSPRPEPPPPLVERRPQPDSPPLPAWVERYRFDVHQYHAMTKAGVLNDDDRVELIDGEIVAMSAIGPEHMATVNSSNRFWVISIGERAIVQIQGSIRLSERDEPQPDVVMLKPRDDFYRHRMPGPDDVLLIIEVANTSLRYDRQVKLALYARFGIPETWIANIQARTIEVYSNPVDGEYTERRNFQHGQTVTPAAFPDIALPVSDVIGGLPDAEG